MLMRLSIIPRIFPLLLLAAPSLPSESDESETQAPETASIETIIVTGRKREDQRQLMLDFVLEIGDPANRSRGYARWERRLCVGVYGLRDQATAQYIADKITAIALENDITTGKPGCRPNLHIIFSPNAGELATKMVEDSPDMFRPFGNTEGTTQGPEALEQFKTSEAAVRWWQITMMVDEVGNPAIVLPGIVDANGEPLVPRVRGHASLVRSGISDAILANLIIVDAGKLNNVRWRQLADYLAMVSLAQINPDSAPSNYQSILNLFTADNPPLEMTDMDRIYLRSLYEIDTRMMPYTQRGVLSNRMVLVQRKLEEGK